MSMSSNGISATGTVQRYLQPARFCPAILRADIITRRPLAKTPSKMVIIFAFALLIHLYLTDIEACR